MSAQTQYSIQSTAGAVPVRNEKGNKIILLSFTFVAHMKVIICFSLHNQR